MTKFNSKQSDIEISHKPQLAKTKLKLLNTMAPNQAPTWPKYHLNEE